jgi:hypothetical protein
MKKMRSLEGKSDNDIANTLEAYERAYGEKIRVTLDNIFTTFEAIGDYDLTNAAFNGLNALLDDDSKGENEIL